MQRHQGFWCLAYTMQQRFMFYQRIWLWFSTISNITNHLRVTTLVALLYYILKDLIFCTKSTQQHCALHNVKCTYFWINDFPNFLFAWTHKLEACFSLPNNNQWVSPDFHGKAALDNSLQPANTKDIKSLSN